MPIKRIYDLDIDRRELFTAIYGTNSSSEVYITPDLRIHNMREALYLYLKGEGYDVIFFDDKAFSYEQEPLMRFFNFTPRTQEPAAQEPQGRRRTDFFRGKGPMSRTRNLDAVAANRPAQTAPPTATAHDAIRTEVSGNQLRYLVMQDEGFFENIFSYSTRHPRDKMAVVFVNPSTLKFEPEERDVILNRWADLTINYRRNRLGLRVLALYNSRNLESLRKNIDEGGEELLMRPPFSNMILQDLADKDGGKDSSQAKGLTLYCLGGPGRDEISSVLNYRRLLSPGGLSALFGRVPWDHIVLRLWQGAGTKDEPLDTIASLRDYPRLNEIITGMDTERVIDRLNHMQGIDEVREKFALYRDALATHRAGLGSGRFRPHMALMGAPGTGKSTVARLFGDILREDGLLPKGHFVKVSVDELVGEYVGHTRPKTRAVCERARGGVLFIDEAYGLMSGKNSHGDADFGKEAIEVLIQFMEDNDDSLVILAGYTADIKRLIAEGNDGFERRFNELGFFYFKDYSPEVLFNISMSLIKVPVTDAFRTALKGIIRVKHAYRNKKFGNVGEMENLINSITTRYLSLKTSEPLDVVHIPDDLRILADDTMLDERVLLRDLNSIIGQSHLKQIFHNLFVDIKGDRELVKNIKNYTPELHKLNFIITGNPGTGKSTIVRLIAEILHRIGVLPPLSDDRKAKPYTETSGQALVGKSGGYMDKLFEDNIGRVIFIDEAYSLSRDRGVIDTIVAKTEHPDYKNKLSVIMAGYPDEMEQMMNINSGFKRRFRIIPFADYTNEELYDILIHQIERNDNIRIDADACREVGLAYFASVPREKGFANGGLAEDLVKVLVLNRKMRYSEAPEEMKQDTDFALRILPCDFPNYRPDPAPAPPPQDAHAPQSEPQPQPAPAPEPQPQGPQIEKRPNPMPSPTLPIGVGYKGVIDCSAEDPARMVTSGKDIYYSVGRLATPSANGTAFVVSCNGRYVVTASHVVEGSDTFTFYLTREDKQFSSPATLLWSSPMRDLAILRVDNLPPEAKWFRLDPYSRRDPGRSIHVVGYPKGSKISQQAILTTGTISNTEKDRTTRNPDGLIRLFDTILYDANTTGGVSGGPVVFADNMAVIGAVHGTTEDGNYSIHHASDIIHLFADPDLNLKH